MFILLNEIDFSDRIRADYGTGQEWKQFLTSFTKMGQLQPIKVAPLDPPVAGKKYKLLMGDRRRRAIQELNDADVEIPFLDKGMIEASYRDEPSRRKQLLLEFAENNERKDFDFIEKAKFIRSVHEEMQSQYQEAWTQEATARLLNVSTASISHYLRVEEAVKTNESVAKASTLKAAVKRMKVDDQIKKRKSDAEKTDAGTLGLERAASLLHLGDARDWIAGISDSSVDFINFDPPWGDNASHKSAENHESFDDDTESADAFMQHMLPQLFRVLKDDRFCIFWYKAWASQDMARLAEGFGFNLQFTRTPCIWYKPDKTADQNRVPEKQLIEAYEMFYILRKGDPIFHERHANNVFAYERTPVAQLIHPTEKPLALCDALVKLCTVPGESIIDPTFGSGAMLDAAIRANRRARGCELSPNFHERVSVRLAEYLKNVSYS
ncbi:MAG: ParB N-terminal domain-containing protein [Blastocatellia bacterium]|nr:ParB N-terminal domain-containing protein [Blastocatellia bacterium]